MGSENLPDEFFIKDSEFTNFSSPEDIFSILEAFENATDGNNPVTLRFEDSVAAGVGVGASRYEHVSNDESFEFQKSSAYSPLSVFLESEAEAEAASASPKCKRQKLSTATAAYSASASAFPVEDGHPRTSHITVERNRRKQMNEHLSVLRALMPCFYVKRVCVICYSYMVCIGLRNADSTRTPCTNIYIIYMHIYNIRTIVDLVMFHLFFSHFISLKCGMN